MSKFCTSCGAQLDDNAGFCTSCGAVQDTGYTAPAPEVSDAQQFANNIENEYQNAQNAQYGQPAQGSDFSQKAGDAAKAAASKAKDLAGNAGEKIKETFDGVTFDSVKNSMNMDNIKNVAKTKNKNTIIGLSALGVIVLIILIILISACSTPGYEKPIKNMFKAIEKTDGDLMVKAFPEYMVEMLEDEMDEDDYDDVSEFIEEELLEDALDSAEDEYGEHVKIRYKVVKKKEIKKSELSDLEDSIENRYDEKVDVSKGYELKLKMTIKGSDDKDTETEWFNVYKIDGKWCVSDMSFF